VPALSFSITPQMHATEIPHLVDSVGVQRTAGENALRLADGRPVFVGPVTLARRCNAVATTEPSDPSVDARRAVDPLQPTDFTGPETPRAAGRKPRWRPSGGTRSAERSSP
jgi:D-apionolactonase